ncbi:MAG: hypothetical protein ACRC6T_03695 [Sarcina sp.]
MKKDFNLDLDKKRNLKKRIILGVGIAVVSLGIVGFATLRSDDDKVVEKVPEQIQEVEKVEEVEEVVKEQPVEETKPTPPPVVEVSLPEYRVEEIGDASIGSCIRKNLEIVVTGEYTNEDLYNIAEKEIKDYSTKNKVNAITVGFYESADKIGDGYEMGKVEFVPNGQISEAINVKAGDYSTFKMVNLIEDKIELPKGEDLKVGSSDIDLIKSEFESVREGNEVQMNLSNGVLKVVVKEEEDNPFGEADENSISVYTDWTLDNMKDDIKSIDITVKTPTSSVRAKLDMADMKTDNGRYFDLFDIIDNIVG